MEVENVDTYSNSILVVVVVPEGVVSEGVVASEVPERGSWGLGGRREKEQEQPRHQQRDSTTIVTGGDWERGNQQ